LSIPDIRGQVPRSASVRLRAYDRAGQRVEIAATGLPARVLQHEYDHLDGVLFFDRMTSFETLTFMDEFRRYWAKDDEA
jgi:peptide deformylase